MIAALLCATVVQMAMALAAPWSLKLVLDNVVGNHPAPLWISWLLPALGGASKIHIAEAAALLTVVIAAITGAAMYLASYLTESLGQSIGNDLRVRLYHHLQELSLAYHGANRVGTMLSTLTGDVQTIQSFASTSTLSIVTDTLSLVAMIVVMLWLRWDFALIALAVTPLLAAFVLRVNKAVRTAVKEVRTSQSDLLATLQEGLRSIDVIKAFTREDRQGTPASPSRPADSDRLAAGPASVSTAGPHRHPGDRGVHRPGALARITAGPHRCDDHRVAVDLSGLPGPLFHSRARPDPDDQHHRPGIGGLPTRHRDLRRRHCHPAASHPTPTPPFRGEIAFENVSFAYHPDVPVLHDVTFDVHPGEMVGIVGPTGGGKSTVLSMIARFRDPDSGRICIDGVDIRDFTLHGLRTQIGFVLQETVLLRGTVADNIAFGRPDATEEQIVRAAQLANADEFIARMPNGYDAMIGDRGATLSGGQRQRIGIARALIRDNPILILDEPTAALDAESEELVIDALDRLMKGRTVIAVAHRLSTLRNADKIVVIKSGIVAENGTHRQLLHLNGIYAELHHLQFGDTHKIDSPLTDRTTR